MNISNVSQITLSSTFDSTFEIEQYSMYDNFPYVRNINLCSNENIKLISGNIIKGYRCKLDTPCMINVIEKS